MSEEDKSDLNDDEDCDALETPEHPPKKPASLLNYYIEQNRKNIILENNFSVSEANSRLRQIFKEELGQKEKQKWKRKHKKLIKKFDTLLELFKKANPGFNSDNFYLQQKLQSKMNKHNSNSNKRNNNTNNKSNQRRKKNINSSSIGRQKNFIMQEFDTDNDNDNNNDDKYGGKRKRRGTGGNRERNDNNNDASNKKRQDYIDSLINDIKNPNRNKRRKKVKAEDLSLAKGELEKMKDFVEEMRIAARNDWTANLKKQPTLNMYKMLERVINELSKKLLHQIFLDECNLLDALRDWVHPLPDGSLTPIDIRSEMYRILVGIELHKNDDCITYLEKSEERSHNPVLCNITDINSKFKINFKLRGMCKTLMYLFCHKDESVDNKKVLRKIIDKLIRTITPSSNLSYSKLREDNDDINNDQYNEIIQRNKLDRKRRNLIRKRNKGMVNNKRARVPQRPSFDFVYHPSSKIDSCMTQENNNDKSLLKNSKYGNVEAKFKKLKQSGFNNQAYKPSITGRRM